MIKIVEKNIDELVPYENNARINDGAVDSVANSIDAFGFKVPVIIDKNNVLVAGHTRVKAAKKLGLKKVPCIIADDLDEDQIKAFRLVDNKASELAEWDFEKLAEEIKDIEIDLSGFDWGINEEDISYIDQLLNDEDCMSNQKSLQRDTFNVTFEFPNTESNLVLGYIKQNGKANIVNQVVKYIKGEIKNGNI